MKKSNLSLLKVIAALLICLNIASCSEDKKEKDLRYIDVAGSVGSGRTVNLSEVASEIHFIPLETTEKSLIGSSRKGVYYVNGVIYWLEGKRGTAVLKIFDKDGKFIREFDRGGRGPEEYRGIYSLQIDNKTGNLCFISNNTIYEYASDGQFIKKVARPTEKKLDGYFFDTAVKLDKNLYFMGVFKLEPDYSLVAIDSTSAVKLLVKFPEADKEIGKKLQFSNGSRAPYSYKYKDTVRLINANDDYVLGIDRNLNIDTSFIINYGKYKLTANDLSGSKNNNSPFLSRHANVFESDGYLFFKFKMGSLAHKPMEMLSIMGKKYTMNISCALFNKKTGDFFFVDQPAFNQTGLVDDIGGGPAFWPEYISEDGYMVSFITADEFIGYSQNPGCSEKFRKIASGLKDSDNPVLVLAKLK